MHHACFQGMSRLAYSISTASNPHHGVANKATPRPHRALELRNRPVAGSCPRALGAAAMSCSCNAWASLRCWHL